MYPGHQNPFRGNYTGQTHQSLSNNTNFYFHHASYIPTVQGPSVFHSSLHQINIAQQRPPPPPLSSHQYGFFSSQSQQFQNFAGGMQYPTNRNMRTYLPASIWPLSSGSSTRGNMPPNHMLNTANIQQNNRATSLQLTTRNSINARTQSESNTMQLSNNLQNEKTTTKIIENAQNISELVTEVNSGNQNNLLPQNGVAATNNSPASIELIESTDESDTENPEMEKNWRIMMLFNGRVKDEDLEPNCERPQTNEGKLFRYPECKKTIPDSTSDEEDDEQQHIEGRVQSTSKDAMRVLPKPQPASASKTNHGYVLPNGRTWVRHMPHERPQQHLMNRPTFADAKISKSPASFFKTIPTTVSDKQTSQYAHQQQGQTTKQKRFTNKSLLILNGRRIYAGSKVCYQFAETGTCQNGIFCIYEHNGNTDHMQKRVCPRLLKGLCRETSERCPNGPHILLQHQMPICDFYLKMCCSKGKDQCPYLHVRHTPGTEPCPEFNKGNCHRGILCDKPHRYYYSIIKQKSSTQDEQHRESEIRNILPAQESAPSPPSPEKLQWIS